MIPNGYAVDLQAARPVECEAAAAPGTYGAAVPLGAVAPGLYLVVVSNPATLRDTDARELRASGTRQLEVRLIPEVPLLVSLRSGGALAAAYGTAAAVLWLIPLVRVC